jgi:hypothetical protein
MKQPTIKSKDWKKILNGEYTDKPFKSAKLGSEISTSWNSNKVNTKIEDEDIIESNGGKE